MDENQNQQQPPQPQGTQSPETPLTNPQPVGGNNRKILFIGVSFILVLLLLVGLWYLFMGRTSSEQATTTTYFSPEPTSSASPSPTDLTTDEASIDASIQQLNQDQAAIEQGLKDEGDDFSSL